MQKVQDNVRNRNCTDGTSRWYSVDIPEATLGNQGRPYVTPHHDLVLWFDSNSIELRLKGESEEELGALVMDPILWSSVTGLDLKYKPLSLHSLVIEAYSERVRQSNGKIRGIPFVILKFGTQDLPVIEEAIKAHKLESFASVGIPYTLTQRPFCIMYAKGVRHIFQAAGRVSEFFIQLCLFSGILQWLVDCTPAAGETSCTTTLGYFYSIFLLFQNMVMGIINPVWDGVMSVVDSVLPWPVKFLFFLPLYILILPYFAWIALLSLVWYCSRFTLIFHAAFAISGTLSFIITNLKGVSSLLKLVVNYVLFFWSSGYALYARFFKPKPLKKVEKKKD
eukprot:TRINITY_DN13605_c0_g1_i1.p1 TRINITY_DN13605_c0_g1~~TRINITY_DN13605_c0_g1_i1.p1  ORF type:complete len:336 (+),score=35.88 TRINITY_DN13605_c0_g1_i1:2-1009(+)